MRDSQYNDQSGVLQFKALNSWLSMLLGLGPTISVSFTPLLTCILSGGTIRFSERNGKAPGRLGGPCGSELIRMLEMKIVISCKYFSPRGGAQTFLFNLATSLVEDGHDVKVRALENEKRIQGVKIEPLNTPPMPKTLRDLAYARASRKALAEEDADVTFGEQKSWGADVVRPGGGVHLEYMKQILKSYPSAVTRTVKSVTKRWKVKELINHYIERKLYAVPGPKAVIANSRLVRDHLLEHYPQLEDRIELIYNGADCERFSPELRERHREEVRSELDIPQDALVGVFVSFDWRRKGLATVIRALSLLKKRGVGPPVYCIVVGKGKQVRTGFYARKQGVGHRLRFVGVAKPDRFYGASDLLLLPSFFDPCANVTFEALACGLPVVTTVFNGAYEVLHPGVDGFYMDDAADEEQMAEFIEYFTDETYLQRASTAARRLALQYTVERMYTHTRQVLEKAARREAASVTS